MGFLFRLLNRSKIKRYDHIISLGYNCEISYQLFMHNKFVESNLFTWANVPSLEILLSVLSDVEQIGAEDYIGPDSAGMYTCNATKIRFHGKTKPKELKNNPELCYADKEELVSRIIFLKKKFVSIAREESHKLYILKIRNTEADAKKKISETQSLLSQINNGSFDLLVVLEDDFAQGLLLSEKDNLYLRTISSFAPDSAVTSKHQNFKEWQRIFDEFVPLHKLKKTKRYKFEEVDQ